jgi:hypothetical protein
MSTTTTTLAPPGPGTESAAAHVVRGRRQTVAVLAVATLFGIWLGTSAPSASPVATPAAPAAQNAVVPAPVVQEPAPLNPRGQFGNGRGR